MTRQKKTPRQRAEEALGVAERKVARLTKYRDHQAELLEATEAELAEAELRAEYLAKSPDLPQPPTTATSKEQA